MGEWTEKALRSLIGQEIQAGNFYRLVAEKISNPKSAKLILKIAGEEDEHRDILSNKYKLISGNRFQPAKDLADLPEYDYGSLEFLDNVSALELTSFAITAEKRIIEQYKILEKDAVSDEDRKLAKKLKKFERKHIRKLQGQYLKLQKRENFWHL